MSFYVRRTDRGTARVGWTGPIRSERQAHKEATAWGSCGWDAEVVPSSPEVKSAVRAWQQAKVTT